MSARMSMMVITISVVGSGVVGQMIRTDPQVKVPVGSVAASGLFPT